MTTTTTAPALEQTAIVLDGDHYVANGIQNGTDAREWADQFHALGGVACPITSGRAYGLPAHIVAVVTGSPEAIEFVLGNA